MQILTGAHPVKMFSSISNTSNNVILLMLLYVEIFEIYNL